MRRAASIPAAASSSSNATSGCVARAGSTASSPSASAQTSEGGRLEQPHQIEADQRLVLGDEDTRRMREHHLGAQAAFVHEHELAAQLVADERPDDGEPRARLTLVAGAVVGDREDDLAVALPERYRDMVAAVLERVPEELREDERERDGALPGERHRLELGGHVLPGDESWTSIARPLDELPEIHVVLAMLREASCTAAIASTRFTESESDFRASTFSARACTKQRRDRLQVVLHAVVDLLCEDTAPTARPCSSATAAWCAIASRRLVVRREGVSRSQTSSPICRRFQRGGNRVAAPERPSGRRSSRPRHECRARRVQRLHGRLDDRLGDSSR